MCLSIHLFVCLQKKDFAIFWHLTSTRALTTSPGKRPSSHRELTGFLVPCFYLNSQEISVEKPSRSQYLLSPHNIQYFVDYRHGTKGGVSSRTFISQVASLPLTCCSMFFLSQWLLVFNPFCFLFLVYILCGKGCA